MLGSHVLPRIRRALIPKSKKMLMAYPATIAAVVVVMFMMLSMSPAMDGVLLKSASAYTITNNYQNIHMDQLIFSGKERSDAASQVVLFRFTASGTNGAFVQDATNIRTTGYIDEIYISMDNVLDDWYDTIGYDGAGMNWTEWYPTTKIIVTITNPNSVATTINIFGGADNVTVTQQDYTDGNHIGMNAWHVDLDTPYVFTVPGTYTVSYAVQVYY